MYTSVKKSALISGGLFLFITLFTALEAFTSFNIWVFNSLPSIQSAEAIDIVRLITESASLPAVIAASIVLLIVFAILLKKRDIVFLLLSGLLTFILVNLTKALIYVPRPTDAAYSLIDSAYPSGHATYAMLFALLLSYAVSRRVESREWRISLYLTLSILALAVGFSRIYLYVHRPSEVIAGIMLAIFCVSISLMVVKRFGGERNLRNT